MSDVRWAGLSHAEIYRRVQAGPGRGASTAVESAWADTEAVIVGIEQRLSTAIAQAGGGWQGPAADATRAGLTPLGRWAADAAGDARLTATGVTAQGEQASWLRNAMPSPTAPLWDETPGRPVSDPLYLLQDAQALEQRAADDAAQAVHLMNTYTSNSYNNIRAMDYWTLPPTVTVETVAGTGPTGAGAGNPGTTGPSMHPGFAGAGSPGVGGSVPAAPGAGPTPPGNPVPDPAGQIPPPVTVPGGPRATPSAPGPAVGRSGSAGAPDASGPGAVPRSTTAPPNPTAPPPTSAPKRGRPGPSAPPGTVRPVVPGVPARPAPAPSWRDLVPRTTDGRPGSGIGVPPPTSGRVSSGAGEPSTGPLRGPATTTAPAEPLARGGGPRGSTVAHPGLYPPMLGSGAGAVDREHRRPDYLVDDGDAFADDRWFPPPVIGADDPTPPRPR